jgi:hypothetical protein
MPRQVSTRIAYALLIAAQCALGAQGIDGFWQQGHFGFNGAAYHQAARNSLRFGLLLPAQYHRGNYRPRSKAMYARAPLALHGHTTASVWLFGDRELSVRLVPAVNGVLALAALLLILRRRWGDEMALLAGTIYLLLPINSIYANMSNHSTGFIFWALIGLECHLRWLESAETMAAEAGGGPKRRRAWPLLGAFFCASFMALQWDWAAYYVMLVIALHWSYASFDPAHRALPRRGPFNREHALLAAFCLMTLASFGGFLLLVELEAGTFRSITSGLALRTEEIADPYGKLWTRALEPMFSVPLLTLAVLWLIGFFARAGLGKLRRRDLFAVAFLVAGTAHTLIFKRSAHIHSYWPWPLNPFMAIAAAEVLLGTIGFARWSGRGFRPFAAGGQTGAPLRRALELAIALAVLAAFFAAYLTRVLPILEEGRKCGGVVGRKRCPSGNGLIFFARRVREITSRTTGVALGKGTVGRIQMNTTLDRDTVPFAELRPLAKRSKSLPDGWVLIRRVTRTPRKPLARLAACYPYLQYGAYFLVDFRRRGPEIRIYDVVKKPADWRWKFFVNSHAPPLEAVRDSASECRMKKELPRCSREKRRQKRAKNRARRGRRRQRR